MHLKSGTCNNPSRERQRPYFNVFIDAIGYLNLHVPNIFYPPALAHTKRQGPKSLSHLRILPPTFPCLPFNYSVLEARDIILLFRSGFSSCYLPHCIAFIGERITSPFDGHGNRHYGKKLRGINLVLPIFAELMHGRWKIYESDADAQALSDSFH